MRNFRQAKTRAAVQFIFTSIVLAVAAIFYLRLYHPFRATQGTLIEKLNENFQNGYVFLALSGVWLIMLISSIAKYARINKFYKPCFSSIFGIILLLAELGGYGFVIYYLIR